MMQTFVQTILQTQSFYRQIIHRKIREHNIDVTFEMLHILRCMDRVGDKVNQQELANLTFKDKSSLSYLIKNMEKRGLIAREEDAADKRNKLVMLTEKGEQLYIQIKDIIEDVYTTLEQNVNTEHIQLCIEYMKEFTGTIKDN
ncbi:DNA-binding MarR family transcriptional regulator [Dysgonomonas sp. PFB1-18]|uniref:MarR family winged helix-turn-helix transcriptional regulator n=1 Tax=unclassified Dysgonomonas TaxID=2630389 RepID=UPI0024766637|nr:MULTISPECIES: MarR family transcriptional regulator [unclassified Dysgonomonas]MDL2303040.1 winged helix DNA-binding protein [Dysgonomonas sp. OttesenSCG-928-D17]MDH6307801.1 DNA-binding MarR family transcriptional regulator [Dysgonomonas sp. PF1-14]MDH6337719.1 DNA-binding MarR family transcriptional regulator [Dysgonomonas sp. PF1-16]MDH6378943.1 DNA-binding MarR family transcriptional regulator [Dysgonomonas sp. PFB1-18]MDH6396578.1 DNA-binding MarR family transcriptional regulator [Dysg